MNIYQEKLLDNYKNPRNYGEMKAPTVTMELENISCGDCLKIQLLVENEIIKDIKFTGEGCAVAIGSASILTDYAMGKNIKEMLKYSLDDLLDLLGIELTISRLKCAGLGLETLQKAIKESYKTNT